MTPPTITAYSRVITNELARFGIDRGAPVEQQVAGTMLLLSAIVGPTKARIKAMSRWGKSHVDPIEKRLRENGIWVGGKVSHANWFDEETGGVGFLCDVLCGTGQLKRSS